MAYPIDGTAYEDDGTTTISGIRVTLTNVTTNDTLTDTTDASGDFDFDLDNLSKGFSEGDQISIYASYGRYYDEIYHIVDISVSTATGQDLTLDHEVAPSAAYETIANVRAFTKAGTSEYSNDAIYNFIKKATRLIDERTGRTWKGVQTETDEYYDGDDTDLLWLNKPDVQSVTEVSIDDDDDGTYTALTVADDIWLKDNAYVVINKQNSAITVFTAGVNTVKVTYTWGHSAPDERVKLLCTLIVANWMNLDPTRSEEIERLIQELKYKVVGGPQ